MLKGTSRSQHAAVPLYSPRTPPSAINSLIVWPAVVWMPFSPAKTGTRTATQGFNQHTGRRWTACKREHGGHEGGADAPKHAIERKHAFATRYPPASCMRSLMISIGLVAATYTHATISGRGLREACVHHAVSRQEKGHAHKALGSHDPGISATGARICIAVERNAVSTRTHLEEACACTRQHRLPRFDLPVAILCTRTQTQAQAQTRTGIEIEGGRWMDGDGGGAVMPMQTVVVMGASTGPSKHVPAGIRTHSR